MEFENLPFSTIVENYKVDYFLFHIVCYCNNNFLYISYRYGNLLQNNIIVCFIA